MGTKRPAMAWWGFLMAGVVMTTSFLVAASPVVSPSPPAEKEKTSSTLRNGKPVNQQQPQGLPSAKMPKGAAGRMQSQGKSPKTVLAMDSSQAIPDQRPMKSDPAALAASRSASDLAPPNGQKSAEDGGKQRGRGPNVPGAAGLSRGSSGRVGKGGVGGGGTSDGKIRGGGKGGGGREGSGVMAGMGGSDVRLKQLKGPPPSSDDDATGLRYLVGGSVDADGLRNGRPQQPSLVRGGSEDDLRGSSAVDRLSSFSNNDVPPLAMAEYLMLTGDFNGFDDALADIVAIGMMAPEEAEVYRDTVRLEYDSLLQQEAEADSEYQEADEALQGGIQPFLPPFAIEYPDYSYYGNQALGNSGRGGPFGPSGFYAPSLKGEKLEEVLQQMLDSIASSYNAPDSDERNESNKSSSSDVKTSSFASSSLSSSSSSPTLEDQLKSLDQSGEKQTKGKTGGSKGGAGKGGAGKGGKGGKGAGGKGGKGSEGGGKGRKQDGKQQPDAEKELKSLASQVPQNKTKEANSTKSRRPPSKQEQPTPP